MNKKTLFLTLLLSATVFLPYTAFAVKTPEQMVEGVKDIALAIGTAIVVIGWIIAGILYLTSFGAPDKIGTAKKAMIAAIIGTVLIVIAKLGYDAIKGLLKPIIGE